MRKRPLVADLVKDQALPKFIKVKQNFPRPKIEPGDLPGVINELLSRDVLIEQIKPGMSIAITAGSRGVANVAIVTKAIADFVKAQGAHPFVIPAMGSHGGATAEGQLEILAGYGVTESFLGCPIKSSMDVVPIGRNEEGIDVYIDKNAAEADGIIVSGRIKPHTAFRGTYESGIMKMMAIGLGKQYGAEVCHESGFKNMAKNVYLFGKTILENCKVLFGVGTIENAYDETYRVVAMNHDEVIEQEPGYLKDAFDHMPRIMVDDCDVLVVDQIGKNFSGDGMDPNITGTFCTPYATGGIQAQRVAVLDLSPETHGNALGVGMASATTQRVFDQLNLEAMYPNAITATVLTGIRIPMIMESDKECIQVCLKSCNEIDKNNPRVVRISNSLHLSEIMLSVAYLDEIKNIPEMEVIGEPFELPFDEDGNLW